VLIKKVIKDIKFELEEIDNLFHLYSNELFELDREPNLLELTGVAGVLHSFYSGIEKIFLSIAKTIDKNIPADINWHKTLLSQMAEDNESRHAIISNKTKEELSEYLAFRHFYRHSYTSHLRWKKMEILVTPLPQTWKRFKSEISSFIKKLEDKEELEF
jgi:hypothetical protein